MSAQLADQDTTQNSTGKFALKAGDNAVERQLVAFDADDDTVTAVTATGSIACFGIAVHALTAAETTAGKRLEVEYLPAGKVRLLRAGGACTRGLKAVVSGTAGRVENVAAQTDPAAFIGRFLKSAVAGDLVPVLIGV